MSELKIHSDKAWEIASHFSDVLASDTRTLAAMIDIALAEATLAPSTQWTPADLEAGKTYARKYDGWATYLGIDRYMGDLTYKFEVHGQATRERYQYVKEVRLNEFLAPKKARADTSTPPPSTHLLGIEEGIERAARYIEKQRDDYVQEFGMYDPSTGVTEFSTAGEEHLSTLEELIDGIRSLHETPTPPGNQIRTAECDGKDAVPVTGQLPVGTASTKFPPPCCTAWEDCDHDGICHDPQYCGAVGPSALATTEGSEA